MPYFISHRLFARQARFFVLLLVTVLAGCTPESDTGSDLHTEIRGSDVHKHVEHLASDAMNGREAGTADEARAANYIADQFRNYGLAPAGVDDTYFQPFDITTGVSADYGGNWLQATGFRVTMEDSLAVPWGGSGDGQTSGTMVFAGYGITAPELNYDDFKDISVRDRIVLILRGSPDGADHPHSAFSAFADVREKVKRAEDLGARGVLLAAGPMHPEKPRLLPVERRRMAAASTIPVLQLSPAAAQQLLKKADIDIEKRQRQIDSSKEPASEVTDMRIEMAVRLKTKGRISRNVVARLKGTEQADEYIVIGAHYDHLGMGIDGSLYNGKKPQVHNGADDNASGTAGLLELADYFAEHRLNKSLLFVAFSGEEMGLLGSGYFVDHPPVPLEQMEAMINMDMIGRLNDHKLMIFGTGSSEAWPKLLDKVTVDSLQIERVPDGVGASDHTSFYNKEIPVIHYFTDTHADYHRPSDDTQWLNYEGTQAVLTHVRHVVEKLDSLSAEDLVWTEAPISRNRDVTLKGPTLGVLPDYGFKGEGMRITGVNESGPADDAGIEAGDIFVELAGREIRDIYDYMEALNNLEKGKQTTIKVLRNAEELTLNITP